MGCRLPITWLVRLMDGQVVVRVLQAWSGVGRAVVRRPAPRPLCAGQSNGFRKSPTSLTKSDAVS